MEQGFSSMQPGPSQQPVQTATPVRTIDPAGWPLFWIVWALSLGLILLEIGYQYFFEAGGLLAPALISGGAFAGGTLIALSLFSSAIFKWYPTTARFWTVRRYLGVAGTLAIIVHVWSVIFFSLGGDYTQIFFSLNPFENALIWGFIGYTILLAMTLTSTDWAMKKMGPKRWKFLHRFIYVGFPASILHYSAINPMIYRELPGAVLVGTTALAVAGQLVWYFKTIKARRYRNAGTYVGAAIIVLTILLAYIALVRP